MSHPPRHLPPTRPNRVRGDAVPVGSRGSATAQSRPGADPFDERAVPRTTLRRELGDRVGSFWLYHGGDLVWAVIILALFVAGALFVGNVAHGQTDDDAATVAVGAARGAAVAIEPIAVPGDCESFRELFEIITPPDGLGWDVDRMLGFARRETGCCPQVRLATFELPGHQAHEVWRTTQGGDRYSAECVFSHVARWDHRSDAGLLQINGINYDPERCEWRHCLSNLLALPVNVETLGDPALNVRAAAALCAQARAWWGDCYAPWRGGSS